MIAQSALLAALLAGLLGGVHCFAMCGGYVAATSTSQPLLPLRTLLVAQLATHAGRLCTYALLGGAFGATGGLMLSAALGSLQQALYVVANLMLLVLAFAIVRRRSPFAALEKAGLALHAALLPAVRRAGRSSSRTFARFAMGLVWGLTPCALVYGVLPLAMLSGSAAQGALVMIAFGLGTLPNVAAASALALRCRNLLDHRVARAGVCLVIAGFGLLGVYRALLAPDGLAHGPFCLVP